MDAMGIIIICRYPSAVFQVIESLPTPEKSPSSLAKFARQRTAFLAQFFDFHWRRVKLGCN